MGANASCEAVVLECLSKNDPRKLSYLFANDPSPEKALVLAKNFSQDVLDAAYNPANKQPPKTPNPYQNYLGRNPLHVAASLHDSKMLAEMIVVLKTVVGKTVQIELGEQPQLVTWRRIWSVRDSLGYSALSYSVRKQNPQSVTLLLQNGTDVNEAHRIFERERNNPSLWSHVRLCAALGFHRTLPLLLKFGGDYQSWGKDGRRPIHIAVEGGHLECVKLLLEKDEEEQERGLRTRSEKRLRAVGKYVVRECTVQYTNEQSSVAAEGGSNGAGAGGRGDATADGGGEGGQGSDEESVETTEVPSFEVRTDFLSFLQGALRDAAMGARSAAVSRIGLMRSNRDRGASLLHLACTNGHGHVLLYLLSRKEFKEGIEDMNDSGKSAIFMAIRHGSMDCLKILVQHGAKVDTKDIENWTVLHEAVKAGDGCEHILKYLLEECKCDVNAVDDDGWTPLHVAARFSSTKAVDVLVAAGCDINAKTEDQETALLLASAQSTSSEVLKKLLENGADLSAHRDTALTPSRLILGRKDFKQLCIILDHMKTLDEKVRTEVIDLESRSETGDTLLHVCVSEQNLEATTKLLAIGARPNEKNHEGIAALHIASKIGNGPIANALLEAKGDPHIVRADGMMPLHIACDSGNAEVVRALIANGCDVNKPISQSGRYAGFTPLMFASRLGHDDITSQLVKAGADLNSQKGDGFTALHLAALNGNTDVCRNLVKAGADYRVADETGYFPLQLATRHNQFDVVSALLETNVEPDCCNHLGLTSLHIASFICDSRLIWLLLRGGADVNAVNNDDATPLHVAAGREQGKVSMQLLLANGARIDVIDNEKDTPLHNACYKGLYQNVRLLLRRGAAASPVNENNVTPLHLAAANGSEETIEALLKYGADVSIKDRDNKTPYKVASENKNRKAMVLLFRSTTLTLEDIAPTSIFKRGDNPASSADDILCVICQNSLKAGDVTRTLPCSHTYHNGCILAWLGGEDLMRHDSCPLCQKSVLPEDISPRQPS